jgi:T3SS negative regulator,GrlR
MDISLDGLWSLEFKVDGDCRYGVVAIRNTHISGGDSQFYWTGRLRFSNGKIWVHLEAKTHSGDFVIFFGENLNGFILGRLTGVAPKPFEKSFTVTGVTRGNLLTVVFTKRAQAL